MNRLCCHRRSFLRLNFLCCIRRCYRCCSLMILSMSMMSCGCNCLMMSCCCSLMNSLIQSSCCLLYLCSGCLNRCLLLCTTMKSCLRRTMSIRQVFCMSVLLRLMQTAWTLLPDCRKIRLCSALIPPFLPLRCLRIPLSRWSCCGMCCRNLSCLCLCCCLFRFLF